MQFSKWVTLGFGALCLIAVAGMLNAPHLYYMAAILLTLPGVSYLLGWYTLRGLTFTRELPHTSWEGEEGELVYTVRNATPFSRYFLSIQEALPAWITLAEEEPPLFNVAAEDSTRVVHHVLFRKRGVYRVHAFEVTAIDPLGVFAFTRRVPCEDELVVYPLPQPLESLPLNSAERYGWQETAANVLQGSGVDPNGVRAYAPGDPLRHIHWRQTAHTGRLTVIDFDETHSLNVVIVLDNQRGTEFGEGAETTLEYGVRLAAAMAREAMRQGASVRLITGSPVEGTASTGFVGTAMRGSGRGQEHLFGMLDALARVEANAAQPISTLVTDFCENVLPGSTLVVLTAHADPLLPPALARYTVAGSHAAVIYIDPVSFGRAETGRYTGESLAVALMGVGARAFVKQKATAEGRHDLELAEGFGASAVRVVG